jgi:hypothetical protein
MNFFELIRQTYFRTIDKDFYSQFGEDKVIKEIIKSDYKNGFYVDVGCYHPKKHSNTYLLHKKKKWSGINIDIESNKIKVFNLSRPQDLNICCPIFDKKSFVKVIKTQKYGVGSCIKKGNKSDINSIPTKSLNDVLKNSSFKNKEIDLLNIDVEGSDFQVLKSLNLKKYKPKMIIIESHEKEIKKILKSKIYKYLLKKKYMLRSWNFYSLIFILPKSKIIRNR